MAFNVVCKSAQIGPVAQKWLTRQSAIVGIGFFAKMQWCDTCNTATGQSAMVETINAKLSEVWKYTIYGEKYLTKMRFKHAVI
jgi:hypothetical protein